MITILNLWKSFGQNEIFRDFSLRIMDGEFLVISGESGSGKTTLLNLIGGLEKPDKGEIRIGENDLNTLNQRRRFFRYEVGFLFQNFALVEGKSIHQNLMLIPRDARSEMTEDEALQKVGLFNKKNEKVYCLSGGEQQRVALARLMMKKCSVILADEPTGSLDAKNADIVMHILHELNHKGKTVVMVTHSEEIQKREKKVLLLHKAVGICA